MTIQWFPGHMTRARREIEQKLQLIDIVIELLDARIPLSSRNPMIDEIVRNKPRIVLLNKADLADASVTERWVAYFAERDLVAIPFNSTAGQRRQEIISKAKQLLKHKLEREKLKGMKPRPMRFLIVGIPNVGKSTLINRLAGRQVTSTGDRPGVTKGQQWIKVSNEMELLDTPGILWPKFEDQTVGYRLAVTGAIKEQVLIVEDVAYFALRYLIQYYPERLNERFSVEVSEIDEHNESEVIVNMMEDIGRKRGCIQSGGKIDLEKASGIILRELRSGKLGQLTFERPEDVVDEQ